MLRVVRNDDAAKIHLAHVGLGLREERHESPVRLKRIAIRRTVVVFVGRLVSRQEEGKCRHVAITAGARLVPAALLEVLCTADASGASARSRPRGCERNEPPLKTYTR